MDLEKITDLMAKYPIVEDLLVLFGLLLLCMLAYFISKHILLAFIHFVVKKSKTKWDDYLVKHGFFKRLAWLAPALVISSLAHYLPLSAVFFQRLASAMMVMVFLLAVGAFLNALNDIYNALPLSKGRSIKAFLQVAAIVVYVLGGIAIVAILFNKSPWVFLSGIGAMTAVLLLIFKDTILSLVASLQIGSYDMIKVGDWIEMSKYGADGDVIDISLHTVRVQNFDKTIVTIPTHKIIEDSVRNWRGMSDSGGRRIKRSVNIDMTSIRFCDEEMVRRFEKIRVLREYIDKTQSKLAGYNQEHGIDDSVLVNGRRMTNIGTFRAYVKAYLRNHPRVNDEMTFLIRQLQPGAEGLPIEIYIFANTTDWVEYEGIQSDIFDHILAVVPEFGLRVYQQPTGLDLRESLGARSE
jgi:miniconductance mechanosensitive channel